ncbi:MAG TPA: class I SAM-dependent methyltransferase [Victivallales bacterium]|nr:class I SAM-dependent methyltransferase [Victivallales bacterium]
MSEIENRNWFKDWAKEYDETLGQNNRHRKLLELMIKSSSAKKNDKILDIGCGTGLSSLIFLKHVKQCSITGIDPSPEMVNIFNEKINKLQLSNIIKCELGEVKKLSYKDSFFDIVTSTLALHHIKDKLHTIIKIYHLLKPGGKLVIGDMDLDATGNINDHKRLLRIMDFFIEDFGYELINGNLEAFSRSYDYGKRHILKQGEYCISFTEWERLVKEAGFINIAVEPLPEFKWFKVLTAIK